MSRCFLQSIICPALLLFPLNLMSLEIPSFVVDPDFGLSVGPVSGSPGSVYFETEPGVRYLLQRSDDLKNWFTGDEFYGLGLPYRAPLVVNVSNEEHPPENRPSTVTIFLKHISNQPDHLEVTWIGGSAIQPATLASSVTPGASGHYHGDGEICFCGEPEQGPFTRKVVQLEVSDFWSAGHPPFHFSLEDQTYQIVFENDPAPMRPNAEIIEMTSLPVEVFRVLGQLDLVEERLTSDVASAGWSAPIQVSQGERTYFRLVLNWGGDLDGDGIPDWAEEDLAHANDGTAVLADPMNNDADNNGEIDGSQVDSDKDGLVDSEDPAPADKTIDWVRVAEMRYAIFPVADSSEGEESFDGFDALMVNDLGEVLFHRKVWQNGQMHRLITETDELQFCVAMGMNNQGKIIGFGEAKRPLSGDDGAYSGSVGFVTLPQTVCVWDRKDVAPRIAQDVSENEFNASARLWSNWYDFGIDYPADSLISDEGKFVASALDGLTRIDGFWEETDGGYHFTSTQTDVPEFVIGEFEWGRSGGETKLFRRGDEISTIPGRAYRIAMGPTGRMVALFDDLKKTSPSLHRLQDGKWVPSMQFKHGLDFCQNGIMVSGTRLLTRVEKRGKLRRGVGGDLVKSNYSLSEMASEFNNTDAKCVDLSPQGWMLIEGASLGAGTRSAEYFVGLPLTLSKSGKGHGIDNTSITAVEGADGALDRAWIMVTNEDDNEVVITAPLFGESDVAMEAAQCQVAPSRLTQLINTVTFESTRDSYADIDFMLKMGPVASLSQPISLKSMPTVKVSAIVQPVTNQRTDSGEVRKPTAGQIASATVDLEEYFDETFKEQCAVDINLTWKPINSFDWDQATTETELPRLENLSDLSQEQRDALSIQEEDGILDVGTTNRPGFEIEEILKVGFNPHQLESLVLLPVEQALFLRRLFIFGEPASVRTIPAGGVASAEEAKRWALIPIWAWDSEDLASITANSKSVLAHEMGHVMLRSGGHPHQGDGIAILPGTRRDLRLMGYPEEGSGDPDGQLLVKEEWDALQRWIEKEMLEGRIK